MLLNSYILGKSINKVIIVHGYLGLLDNWKTVGRKLSEEGYEVHLLDLRNHGQSFHSEEFSYEIMLKDIEYYRSTYNINEFTLLGHSMGGKLSMLYAVTYPNRIKKLIIADIAPKFYKVNRHVKVLEAVKKIDSFKILTREFAKKILEQEGLELSLVQFLIKNLCRKGEYFEFKFNSKVLVNVYSKIAPSPLLRDHVFDKETLFIKGEISDYILSEDRKVIKNHFPNSDIMSIKGAGHWLHTDRPKEFYELVSYFIKK